METKPVTEKKQYIYTKNQALENCRQIVKNELAAKVLVDKYFLCNEKKYLESTPQQMWDRLANAITKAEHPEKQEFWQRKFRQLLDDFKFVPAGRVLYGLGNPYVNVTLKNCYVIAIREDSIKGIFQAAYEMAETYKSGGGCGIDISPLRPRGSYVHNAARESTGSTSFMDFFSHITGMIGQKARIGALLLCIDVSHPDVEDFISIKGGDDLNLVRYANISVKVTDEFMNAVVNDKNFDLRWGGKIYKTIQARALWDKLIYYAWKRAEPGLLFWDAICRELPAHNYPGFKTIATNPCVTGDMKLLTSDGYITMKELWVQSGQQEYDGKPTIKKYGELMIINSNGIVPATNVYRTSESAPAHRIKLENNIEIDATPNHKFILKDGIRKALSELKIGDELSIINQKTLKITSIEYLGERETFCLTEPKNHEMIINKVLVGQCGETNLSDGDSCNLGSINLNKYVRNSFKKPVFDYESFESDIRLGVRFLDNIITLEKAPLPFQQRANDEGRRLGLGIMGLADMFLRMNIKYDSDEALKLSERVMDVFMRASYTESCELAVEKGAFPVFDADTHFKSDFIKRLPEDIQQKIRKTGIRNIAVHAIAPTGSLSCIAQCSSSAEPVFAMKHIRRTNLGTAKQTEDHAIVHPIAQEYLDMTGGESFPEHFVSSHQISPDHRIKLQALINRYLDQSISNTINYPSDATKEQVSRCYVEAWKSGCKGITVYRDGSREGVLISTDCKPGTPTNIQRHNAPKRPDELDAKVHVIKPNGKTYTVFVGLLEGRPYEVFALDNELAGLPDGVTGHIIRKKDGNDNVYHFQKGALSVQMLNRYEDQDASLVTRLLSTGLRHGVPIEFLSDQILKAKIPITSFAKAIGRAIAMYIKPEEAKNSFKCPECGSRDIKFERACMFCRSCGHSICS